jgi:hypothetical protein
VLESVTNVPRPLWRVIVPSFSSSPSACRTVEREIRKWSQISPSDGSRPPSGQRAETISRSSTPLSWKYRGTGDPWSMWRGEGSVRVSMSWPSTALR